MEQILECGAGIMEENTDIYQMELHEQIKIRVGLYITRVPGGWMYGAFLASFEIFVPYNDEFNETEKHISIDSLADWGTEETE